jgi:hypothetical protein
MSFDKMNQFVDEHTILMRDFLRNISTFNESDLIAMQDQQTIPMVTLTPQTPKTLKFALPKNSSSATSEANTPDMDHHPEQHTHLNVEPPQHSSSRKQTSILINHEVNFDLDLIDLGKQLSVLHSLLVTILAGLDESTKKKKFDQELVDILVELTEMKRVDVKTGLAQCMSMDPSSKLYSYENRLHQAIMTKNSSLPTTPTTPPLVPISSGLLANRSNDILNASGSQATSTSSSSSSKNSSQLALNDNRSSATSNAANSAISNSSNKPVHQKVRVLNFV